MPVLPLATAHRTLLEAGARSRPAAQVIPRVYTLALMEYIAHLTTGDWDSLVDDLVALGFVDSVEDRENLVCDCVCVLV